MGVKSAARRLLPRGDVDARIARLEGEVQECRQLQLRLAELYDVVTELLIPIADRDEEKARELLARYRAGLSPDSGSPGDA